MDLHGILVVDKPRGPTSHDIVAQVRRLLKTRKVGHAGTLDPAAEGVLVLGIGRATKLLGDLTGHTKRYAAQVVLGVDSVSGDIEGPAVLRTNPASMPPRATIQQQLAEYIGSIEQIPPAHAAIKVDGQPLYERARRGEIIDVPRRQVVIHDLTLIGYQPPSLFLDITCSAGTYIRALARDIGASLETGAYLHYLLRVESGQFGLPDAWTIDTLQRRLRPETFEQFASHPSFADRDQTALVLGPEQVKPWYDGRPVTGSGRSGHDQAFVFTADGSWLGLGQRARANQNWQPTMVIHR